MFLQRACTYTCLWTESVQASISQADHGLEDGVLLHSYVYEVLSVWSTRASRHRQTGGVLVCVVSKG